MTIDIDALPEAELLALNRRIVERLRLMQQLRAQAGMARFNVGERVCFDGDVGQTVFGTLVRHNKKTVSIHADDGRQWRVSPGLVRAAAEVRQADTPPQPALPAPD